MTHSIPTAASHPVRGDAKALIASSALPAEAQALITEVVRHSRLWKREKAEVTVELIAHFHDGLDSGRSVQDLIATFGPVATSAKLIRRAKTRNRPLWWRTVRRVEWAMALCVLVYLASAALFSLRHPLVSVDYVAQLNRPLETFSPGDCAWPIYREAWIDGHIWDVKLEQIEAKDAEGNSLGRDLRPGDAEWPRVQAFLARHQVLLDAARLGSAKPALGLPARHDDGYSELDRQALFKPGRLPATAPTGDVADRLVSQSLLAVILPDLSGMRTMARLLALDMYQAAATGDTRRATADCQAMLGLARQIRQTPTLVHQFVCLGIVSLADTTLARINHADPSAFAAQRVEILHEMARAESLFALDFASEQMFARDMIQRIYSDDGHGDGTITRDGLQVIARLGGAASRQRLSASQADGAVTASLLMPAAVTLVASRREVTEELDRYYLLADRDAHRPYWERLRSPSATEQILHDWRSSLTQQMRLAMLDMLVPALNRAIDTSDEAKAVHQATTVAMALEVYRDRQGRYPESLAELVPHYLPVLPLDHSTGGTLRYKLKDGKPLLYGLGKDGQDDGGVWTDKIPYPHLPAVGDWVLYPPIDRP